MLALEPLGNQPAAQGHRVNEPLPSAYRVSGRQFESSRDPSWLQLRTLNQRASIFGNSLTLLLTYGTEGNEEPFEMLRMRAQTPAANARRNPLKLLLANDAAERAHRNRRAWSALRAMIGTVHGPKNWADEHDHYLYGPRSGETSS